MQATLSFVHPSHQIDEMTILEKTLYPDKI